MRKTFQTKFGEIVILKGERFDFKDLYNPGTGAELPDLWAYGIRHGDDLRVPSTIEKTVIVNHWGSMVLDFPIQKIERVNNEHMQKGGDKEVAYIALSSKWRDRLMDLSEWRKEDAEQFAYYLLTAAVGGSEV